jgi:hypothetical protein
MRAPLAALMWNESLRPVPQHNISGSSPLPQRRGPHVYAHKKTHTPVKVCALQDNASKKVSSVILKEDVRVVCNYSSIAPFTVSFIT